MFRFTLTACQVFWKFYWNAESWMLLNSLYILFFSHLIILITNAMPDWFICSKTHTHTQTTLCQWSVLLLLISAITPWLRYGLRAHPVISHKERRSQSALIIFQCEKRSAWSFSTGFRCACWGIFLSDCKSNQSSIQRGKDTSIVVIHKKWLWHWDIILTFF